MRRADNRVSQGYPGLSVGLGTFIEDAASYGTLYGHSGGLGGFSSQVQFLDGPGDTVAGCLNSSEDSTSRTKALMRGAWVVTLGL